MSKNPNHKSKPVKKGEPMNGAMKFFLGGCFAELYLLLIRRFFISGTLEQVVAWDGYLRVLTYVGLAVLVLGAVLVGLWWKKQPGRRFAAVAVLAAGVFLAAASWLVRRYVVSALTPLCVVVPAVMILGILWSLYDRECAWALTILGAGVGAVWICRKGIGTLYWNTQALACGAFFIVLMLVCALLARKASKNDGLLGKLRLFPGNADCLPIYAACGISAIAVAVSMCSASIAYYAMWALAVVIFALAVYYTVKQL